MSPREEFEKRWSDPAVTFTLLFSQLRDEDKALAALLMRMLMADDPNAGYWDKNQMIDAFNKWVAAAVRGRGRDQLDVSS